VEWKWLLLPDPADFRLPKASPNAIPMPTSRKAQKELNAKRPVDDIPRKDDEFVAGFTWAEFHAGDPIKNSEQVKLDLSNEDKIWHYLGQTSTELRAQYTGDLSTPEHNLKSNFLDSIPKPPKPLPMAAPPKPRRSYSAAYPQGVLPKVSPVPLPGTVAAVLAAKQDKPYIYKPRASLAPAPGASFATQHFAPKGPLAPAPQATLPQLQPHQFLHRPPYPPALQPRPGPEVQHQRQYQLEQPQQLGNHQQHQPQKKKPSLHIEHYRPLAKDQRTKNPLAAPSSDRIAPVGGGNGFPQLPGLTWPPAHMTSGNPQPYSTTGLPPIPMTSSVIKSRDSGHPQAAGAELPVHQKYAYFQIHHNR